MTGATPLPLFRAALAAAARGWPVFPLIPGGKRPAITGWPNQATVDADVLAVWWRDRPYNVGIACGPAGLLVVDLDGPHGRARFAELAADAEPMRTFTVATPSGGEHRYYRIAPGVLAPSTVARLGAQIDTRGTGGYVVGPGSVRSTVHGRRHYRVIDRAPPAVLPNCITAPLQRGPRVSLQMRRPMHSAYGQAAVAGECARVRRARTGTRNSTVLQAAVRLGRLVGAGVLDQQHVQEQLRAASTVHCGTAGFTTAEAERAIANGLRYGQARPRPFQER
jgi:hypothetical protein